MVADSASMERLTRNLVDLAAHSDVPPLFEVKDGWHESNWLVQ